MTPLAQQTTRDLRWHNRSDLLARLYLGESTSRNDLARASGLSPATVSNVVSDLINEGLVAEVGSVSSAGGRPRALLRVRPDFGHVVGVDIAETRIQVGLFDWTLALVAEEVYPVVATRLEPVRVVEVVLAGIDRLTAEAGIAPDDLLGVGVGVPGAVQADALTPERTLVHAPTLGWSEVPLAEMLAREIGTPLHIDNGAMALGQAETWRGAARGAERAVTVLLGVGAGAALTMAAEPGGRARSITIEWGHTVIEVGGPPCRCGSRGCLETFIGAETILRHYQGLAGSEPFIGVGTEDQLAELVGRRRTPAPGGAAGARAAARAVDQALGSVVTYLGIGIGNLVNLLGPDRVVLSGWAGAILGPALLPAVRDTVSRHTLPYLHGRTRIEQGELGPEAVALGAATLPVARLLADGGRATTSA
ncbi:putative NBD/HSP70 family sugar kinase [Streptacidiphilus sp. MAP12-16]|uniref:ROK family transcriptional regulator n=1 Tax=Streptacidiphilus sp. MAP12-16 TaxID=3156300 RepID=UPI0035185FC6